MAAWLIIAEGPLLRLALALLVLGLLRLVLLSMWGMWGAWQRTGDKHLPLARILQETGSWLVPLRRLGRVRPVYSYASFGFHVGLLIAVLFLQNHIDILSDHILLRWPAIIKPLLDGLTLLTLASAVFLLFHRIYQPSSRQLSRPMDYILLGLILTIFASGFIAGQSWNPIPYDGLMLAHTLVGIALIVLIPFTKISHCVLYPLIRLASELAWHFTAQDGEHSIQRLYGPEGREL